MESRQTTTTQRPRRIRGLDAQARVAQRRGLLLDSALDLFADRGFHNTSVELICQNAYVSTKSFYQVFANREECYLALYERTAAEYRNAMAEALAGAPDDEMALAHTLIDRYVRVLLNDRRKAQITFGSSRAISVQAERIRRENRLWAADFVNEVWVARGVRVSRTVAVALIGGIFDVVTDHLLMSENTGAEPNAEIDTVVDDLLTFYTALRLGLTELGEPSPGETAAGTD